MTETEFPGRMMADVDSPHIDVVNKTKLTQSTWISGKSIDETWPANSDKNHLTRMDGMEVNCLTYMSDTKAYSINDIAVNEGDATLKSEERMQETASHLQSFTEKEHLDWWNNPLSFCEQDYHFYETDESEDIPYWFNENVERNSNEEAKGCCNKTVSASSDIHSGEISQQMTSTVSHTSNARSVSLENANKYSNCSKTEEKIRKLKALLAEQEKEIKRLKSESTERISDVSSPMATAEYCGFQFGKSQQRNFKEPKTHVAECSRRKRTFKERSSIFNSKRFRYSFRKDMQQEMRNFLPKTTDRKQTIVMDKPISEYVKPDLKKGNFTKDEFLSLLRLVRTTTVLQE